MFIEGRDDSFGGLEKEIRYEIGGQVVIGIERLCRGI